MEVTIEQYRARIGAHHNIRIKQNSTCLEGNIYLTMLMFIFQFNLTIITRNTCMQQPLATNYTARNAQVAAGLSSACRRMSSTGRISDAFARHVAACRHMAATVCRQICYKTVLTELQQCCWEQICYKLV